MRHGFHGSHSTEVPMRERMMTRPLLGVLTLELAFAALVVLAALTMTRLLPGLPGYSVRGASQSLVVVLLTTAVLLVLIATFRWWTLAGFTPPSQWRDLKLYWLPIVLLLVPFAGGGA